MRSRSVSLALSGLVSLPGIQGYQVLYRTNGVLDSIPLVTVTTIFVPGNTDHSKLLSYALAEDADNIDCAPSYNFQEGNNSTDSILNDVVQIELYLLKGFIVSSPDYEGPNATFAAGKLLGHGILDGLRATTEFLSLKNPNIGMVGYSGGAIATGWAAALAPTYASELRIVGVATGGTPANFITSISNFVLFHDGLFASLAFVRVTALITASIC